MSHLVDIARRNPGVNVVVPKSVIIDAGGRVVRELRTPEAEVADSMQVLCDWLDNRRPLPFAHVGTVLGRTSVIRQFGGYKAFTLGMNIDNLAFVQYAITGGRQVGFASDAVFNWRVVRSQPRWPSDPVSARGVLPGIREARQKEPANGRSARGAWSRAAAGHHRRSALPCGTRAPVTAATSMESASVYASCGNW